MRFPFFPSVSVPSLLLASLALAGCAGPMTYGAGSQSTRISALYGYGAADRDLKLIVQGNAFPGQVSSADFGHQVEAALQSPINRAPTHLTQTPDDSAKDNYKVVFLFNPSELMGGQNLCDGRADQAQAAVGEVRALAAFCVAGRAVTEISGRTAVSGPKDERFAHLMSQMKEALFRADEKDSSHKSYTNT